jgi:membrane-bound serine protease (ClpP class)
VGIMSLIVDRPSSARQLKAEEDGLSQKRGKSAGEKTVYRVPIEGTIDLGLAPFVSRVVAEASNEPESVLLLDIDTFGGRVDAAVLIRDALIDAPVRTIAFVNPRAISAGALISLACHDIVMTPGASIGAATPVTGGGTQELEAADEKVISYWRTEMRTTAEKRGRRGDVAEAMVDRDVEIKGVVEKGKVLTLSTQDALELEIADGEAANLEDLLDELGLEDAKVEERKLNWAEILARAVSEPMVSSFLLSIGFLGIMIELYQPGWGIPGSVGLVSLLVFFFGHHVVQLAGWEELLLFALGVALLLLELLVIPGFGIAGISGIILMLAAALLSLLALDFRVSWDLGFVNRALIVLSTSVIMTTVVGYVLIRLLPATGATRRIVLGKALDKKDGFVSHDTEEEVAFPLGTAAEAITDLRPAGKVQIDRKRIDAVSEGDFIPSGASVTITGWRSGTAVVRQKPNTMNNESDPA